MQQATGGWRAIPVPGIDSVTWIDGRSLSDFWLGGKRAGRYGAMAHWNGAAFEAVDPPPTCGQPDDVPAAEEVRCGEAILRYLP